MTKYLGVFRTFVTVTINTGNSSSWWALCSLLCHPNYQLFQLNYYAKCNWLFHRFVSPIDCIQWIQYFVIVNNEETFNLLFKWMIRWMRQHVRFELYWSGLSSLMDNANTSSWSKKGIVSLLKLLLSYYRIICLVCLIRVIIPLMIVCVCPCVNADDDNS